MVILRNGNLFEGNYTGTSGTGSINKFTPDGQKTVFATGLNGPLGLAFDNTRNLFEGDNLQGHIYKFAPDGTRSTFASGLGQTFAVAFNNNGILFESGVNQSYIINTFTPDGTESIFATGLNGAFGIAFGPAASTPEPGTWTLLAGLGLSGSVFLRRRKRRTNKAA